jgi:GT2 family glycosyltransferase/MoaA/NifB/PqqE/SkfB family radical SAM enzyme/Flp pilus assembly protein TadD/glycosyltransferase involved in cell wall biosynthesis
MDCIPNPLSKDVYSTPKHPGAIFVQLTTACNAKCINCPHPSTYGPWGHNPKGVMTDGIWDKIIGDIQAMGYRNQVGLYLHHEPLLERTLFNKIRQINEETEAFAVISTNGSLLNDRNRRSLIDAKPRIVHININSAEKDQYEKMTGLSFEITIRQAKRFIAEAAGKVHVEINCPVLPEVDVEKLIGLFPGVQVNADFWANSRGGLLEGISSKGKGSRFKISDYCLQPEQNFNILFDSSVIICCNDWSHESKNDFPNIMARSILEIYNGDMMKRSIDEFKSGDYGRYLICGRCSTEMGFTNKEISAGNDDKRNLHLKESHAGSSVHTNSLLEEKKRNVTLYRENYLNRVPLVTHKPVEFFIESANSCNLKCLMCPSTYKPPPADSPIVSLELVEKTRDFNSAVLQAHLHGFGEPLMNRKLTDIIHSIRRSGGPVLFDFFTNATLMSRRVSESLVDANVDRLILSIDGSTKGTYEAIHRGAKWERLLRNLKDLNDVKRIRGSLYPTLEINFIAMNMNFHELPGLVELAAEQHIGKIDVKNLVFESHYPIEVKSQHRIYDPESDDDIIAEAKRIAKQYGIEIYFDHYYSSRVSSKVAAKVPDGDPSCDSQTGAKAAPCDGGHDLCFQPWKTFYLKSNGEVKPCCFSSTLVLGNLRDATPEEIWNGVEYRRLRESISRGVYPEGCRNCVTYNLRPRLDDTDHWLQVITERYSPSQKKKAPGQHTQQRASESFHNHVNTAGKGAPVTSIEERLAMAVMLIREGKPPEAAIRDLEAVIAVKPDLADAHHSLGALYQDAGNMEKARKHYETACYFDPDNRTYARNLADFRYVALKNIPAAIDLYKRILKAHPNDSETLLILGNLHVETGDFDAARSFYLDVLQIDPDNQLAFKILWAVSVKSGVKCTDETAHALYRKAQSFIKDGRHNEAVTLLNHMTAVKSDEPLWHNDLGYLYYTLGDKPRARSCYETAVRLDPTFSTALKNLADVYFVIDGRMEEALELYRKVLARRPDDFETLIALGQLCSQIGHIEDSLYFFRRVLELDPGNSEVRDVHDTLIRKKKSNNIPPMTDKVEHLTPDKQMNESVSMIQRDSKKTSATGIRHMNVLLTNHHLTDFTGSEVFTFTIADFLKRKGHRVTVLSKYVDNSLRRYFDRIGVAIVHDISALSGETFDVAHIHHNVMAMEVRRHFTDLPLVFLSHGVIPFLEQNPPIDIGVSLHLAVSEEVHENLIRHGVDENRVKIFRNIVDSDKFSPRTSLSARPARALILSNKLDLATERTIREACDRLDIVTTFAGMRFGVVNQDYLPDMINQADIVFTLGRGVIETMMCGRVPIVLDHRGGDGMVTPDNVEHYMKRNFSGRTHRRMYRTDELMLEIVRYEPSFGESLRRMALDRFDADKNIGHLIDVYKEAMSLDIPPLEEGSRNLIDAFLATVDTTRHFSQIEASRMIRSTVETNPEKPVADRVDTFLSERLKKLKPRCRDCRETFLPFPALGNAYDILIPIFNAFEHLQRCIDSVLRHTHSNHAIYLLDDCSTDSRVLPLLKSFEKADPRVRLIESSVNKGFVHNVNRGFELSENDVVILNSDTEVTEGWLDRMHRCLNSHPDIGIVCPLSNNATILSVPVMNQSNILPGGMDPNRFGSLIAEVSRRTYPEIPTGVGFCMLISRDTLRKVGAFDPAFGLGYGEENDFCMRARVAGKKIVCCDDAYVHHYGEASFGSINRISEKRKLNERLLEQKWPNYKEEIYRFCCINPLREIQERIFRKVKELEKSVLPGVLHVLHNFDAPGGTELHTRNIIDGLSSRFHSTVLFPASLPEQWVDLAAKEVNGHLRVLKLRKETVVVTDSFLEIYGDLTNEYVETIFSYFLRGSSPSIVHFQHLGGWSSMLLPLIAKDQGLKVLISLHDYYLLCPDYNLILPDLRRCGKTIADSEDAECLYCLGTKRKYHGAGKPSLLRDYLAERKQIIKRVIEAADILVAPSDFVRERFIQAYGEAIKDRIVTVPHGIEPLQKSQQAKRGNVLRVGFLGNASDRKGAFVLLQAAKILKGKPIRLEIFGGVPPSLTKTANDLGIIQHGFYKRSDLPRLLSKTSLVMIPSVWDETFCLTASESQMMGIPVIASDCGAISERIVDGETGFLVPPGNAKALAARLLEILDDPTRLERVAANLRDSRLKTMEENIEDYAQVYDRLLDIREYREPKDQSNSTPDRPERDLTSIVILTFNELDYSKNCVESIRRHTPEPHEIIFVDNGSKDGTIKWLRELVKENPGYRLIENGKNLGFAKGCNQGIEAATGNDILLLNNDTVVTDRWLSGMLECLKSTPETGIVGPMTNNISGVQKVEGVGYDAIEGLESYARSFREKNRHRRTEARRVVGFCMLFRRSLVDQIGLLDESFGTGNFEDDDFCARAALAGYRNVIAGDVFIHHFGSRSFIGNRIDYGSSLTGNRKIYNDKWRDIEQKPHEGRKIRALVARELAWKSSQQGNVKGALDLYLSAIQQDPQDKRNYTGLAQMLIQSGRHGDALDALRQCPIASGDADRLVLEGQCREGLNELEEAGNLADLALSMNEVHAPALNLKGILAFRQNAAEEARESFEKAAEADPSWGEPLTNLGVLLWKAGERDESIDLLEKGFILSPHVVDLAERYHAAAVSLGAQARAENVFREARGIYPPNRRIAFLLIDLLISQDKHAEAMEEIEAAMAAFDVDDGLIAAALEVRGKIGPPEIKKKAKEKTLSLCMIVKNEQTNLVRCLSSIKAAVDEMIVVDTGSTDRTKELAAVFGAKVFDFNWDEDFSSARNFSLSKATGDWILVIDADETVSSRDHETIRDLILKSQVGTGGYYLTTRNYVVEANTAGWVANDGSYRDEDAGTGWYPNRKVRLFRNDPRIRFSGAVHELVEAAMQNAGMRITECSVPIHHSGKLDRASVLEKGQRYYLLGLKKIEETGGTPRAILELAIQAGELGRYDDAIRLWKRYLDGKPAQDVKLAYVNLINACLNADRFDEALVEARKAAGQANGTRELLLNCAAAEFFTGDLRKAIRMAEKILRKDPDYPPALGLFAMSLALAGHEERGMGYLQRLCEQGLELRSQILPVIVKLRLAGKKDESDKLLRLLDRQPQVLSGPIEPSPDRSRQTGSHQALRGI